MVRNRPTAGAAPARGRTAVSGAVAAAIGMGMLAALLVPGSVASAESQRATPPVAEPIEPVMTCADLLESDLTGIPDASTVIDTAEQATAPQGHPICKVKGTIEGRIQFVAELPTKTWTGRYLQTGCGAFCGYLFIGLNAADGCESIGNGEFALAADDTGHVMTDGGASWGHDDLTARADWGWRSEHLTSLSLKGVLAEFYGQPPEHAYFDGCSNGGRQALMLAQRFPHDFDGIIASAPGNIYSAGIGQSAAYLALANRDSENNEILGVEKLAPLHRAVVRRCDDNDGLVDGQITDPRGCRFDPASVACPPGKDRVDCLTPAQVRTVRTLYRGVRDRQGRRLYPGGLERGSELGWAGIIVSSPDMQTPEPLAYFGAEQFLKHLAFRRNPPESFTLPETRFGAGMLHRLKRMGRWYDSDDPDLSEFRDAGGKLIISHGWSDGIIPPRGTLAYRQAIEDELGGYAKVQEFSRLFMLPHLLHCEGGDGPNRVDLVTPLVRWVERGRAPQRVVATQRVDGQVVRTRPVYNYPVTAAYDGTGDIDRARNFRPDVPAQRPDDHIDWLGSFG